MTKSTKIARFVVHGDARTVRLSDTPEVFVPVVTEPDGTRVIYIEDTDQAEEFRKLLKDRGDKRQRITDEGFVEERPVAEPDKTPSSRKATVANAGAKRE